MMLIVLPNPGSVFSGDGLGGVPGCFALAYSFERNYTTHIRLYTYVLLSLRVPDDENHGSIRQGSAEVPPTRASGLEGYHQSLWENQTNNRIRGWETDRCIDENVRKARGACVQNQELRRPFGDPNGRNSRRAVRPATTVAGKRLLSVLMSLYPLVTSRSGKCGLGGGSGGPGYVGRPFKGVSRFGALVTN